MTKRQIFITILGLILGVIVWKLSEPQMKAQNKYQCAVYGYYEDCKTKLPEELKLK